MSMQFQFFGFDPNDELQKDANRSLEKLIDQSPYGSVPVALLERTKEGFRCEIDLYTRHGPLIAHSCQDTANRALTKVYEVLQQKLSRWRAGNRSRHLSPEAWHFERDSAA